MAKDSRSPEIRITLASARYARLLQLSDLLGETPNELVKLSIDYYYNSLLLSGAMKKDSTEVRKNAVSGESNLFS